MTVWRPQEPTSGKLGEQVWVLQPYRGPGETAHHLTIDGERLEVRPDSTTTGSSRSKAIRKALAELASGEIDPLTYVRGRLTEAGAGDVQRIQLPEESLE